MWCVTSSKLLSWAPARDLFQFISRRQNLPRWGVGKANATALQPRQKRALLHFWKGGAKLWLGFCCHTELRVGIWGWCNSPPVQMLAKGGMGCEGSPSPACSVLLEPLRWERFYNLLYLVVQRSHSLQTWTFETSKNQRWPKCLEA